MRYTPYRGLTAVSTWVKLKFAALNLKKLAIHKWMLFRLFPPFFLLEALLQRGNRASLTGCTLRQPGAKFCYPYTLS